MRKLPLLILALASCGRPKPVPPVYQEYEQPVVQSAPAPLIQQQPMVYPMQQQPTIIRERNSGMDWLPYMMLMNSGGSTHRTVERHFHHSEPAPPAVVPQQPVQQRSMWNSFHEARQASKPGRYSSGGASVSGPSRSAPTRSRSGYNRPSRSSSSSSSGRSYNRPSRSR